MLMPPIPYATGPSHCEMCDEYYGIIPMRPLLDGVRYHQDVKAWIQSSHGAWYRACTNQGV